ncbi:MAG: PD-(D/E)XK nuclease family protein [Candidatus Thorarchaeota archaeon]
MNNIGHYNDGSSVLPPNQIKISPSSFSRFFGDKSHEWWRELILGSEGFTGNSGSHIGNIVHHQAECTFANTELTNDEIEDYISTITDFYEEGNYARNTDTNLIRSSHTAMRRLIYDYVNSIDIESSEGYLWKQILPGVVLAGSYDALVRNSDGTYTVLDWKTCGDKLPPKKMSYAHQLQSYLYAHLLELERGIKVSSVRIVYITRFHPGIISEKTGRTGKSYEPTLTPIDKDFNDGSREFIASLVSLVSESLAYLLANPDSFYLLARDYRLKNHNLSSFIESIDFDQPKEQFDF